MRKLKTNKFEGVISISSRGTGYVAVPELPQDPEIDYKHLNTALHGDVVEIVLHPKSHRRQGAEVTRIISRAKTRFAGVLEKEEGVTFLRPDDTKMYTDILIPENALGGTRAGEKVLVEITSWKDYKKAPQGKVLKALGRPGENDVEMRAIAIEKGFDTELPRSVEEEARKIREVGIQKSDYENRRDFRKILTFTIDPEDAKDFDDAISFKPIGQDQYEVGIHIADVTHYVKPNSLIDQEARGRGTSVYLVDRTIPMLPEILSNDLCSLVPREDRLTMSAVFTLDKDANIRNSWFGRTVIRSAHRFTYVEAEKTIKKVDALYHKELATLNRLAKKLAKRRFENGAILLDQEEVKFVLDKNGTPIKVIKKEHGDSNDLIEEFMLLANRNVSKLIAGPKGQEQLSIYRVHDLPSKEKMEDLALLLRSLGHKVNLRNGIIPSPEINKLLKNLEHKDGTVKDTVHRAVIRSMAKAVYSVKNIGHYGLAFAYYTHFTSPIRRYPDMMVHRLLSNHLAGKKTKKEKLEEKTEEYTRLALKASEQEKRASDAERASIKYKQAEYMSERIGEVFEGVLSGITQWGMYVEEVGTKCEGLVRVRDMNDDFYVFNEKKLELFGQKKKKKYRLGNKVKIKVRSVDLERKTIDYILV